MNDSNDPDAILRGARTDDSLALLTDLYQLTMSQGYWINGRAEMQAVFHLFFRSNPFDGGYAVAAGLQPALDFLGGLHFSAGDLNYLRTLTGNDGAPLFNDRFIDYLCDLRLTVDVDAVPEGTVVFPHEPLLRISGPILQCQILETFLLNAINFSTLIATKSARVSAAAGDDTVMEFGLRRAQGIDGGLTASRASYIGGCDATSNVLAGRRFGIPVKGTHAHSWVMSFDSEVESFRKYATAMPNNCIFLVDTYDTVEGVRHAVEVALELRNDGHEMIGIRLDSGDLAELSKRARAMLDAAGFPEARIVASNDLDEYAITRLKQSGAKIDTWGIGTMLVTAYDQPALGGVYKLAKLQQADGTWVDKIKLSNQRIKTSNPGRQQVRRFLLDGIAVADVIYDCDEPAPEAPFDGEGDGEFTHHDLLVPAMRAGAVVYPTRTLQEARRLTIKQLSMFAGDVTDVEAPAIYDVRLSKELQLTKDELIAKHTTGLASEEPLSETITDSRSTAAPCWRSESGVLPDTSVLVLVDLQNDFLPGGSLAVPGGDEVIPVANRLIQRFQSVVLTQDWHPADHGSFAANHDAKSPGDVVQLEGLDQVLWPVHCVRKSRGAAFANQLTFPCDSPIFRKGGDARYDSYSGFFDNGRNRSTGMGDHLVAAGAKDLYVMGLATDYCVKFTVLDALSLGFNVTLITDGCRGVNLSPGDVDDAITEVVAAGAKTMTSEQICSRFFEV